MVSIHDKYARKIIEIGDRLGYDSKGVKTKLGRLDARWCETRLTPYLEKKRKIPIVAFEVICSEGQKELRGSLLNMLAAKPALAVFVLIREEIKKHSRGESPPAKWLQRIERYVEKLREEFQGVVRIEKWYEDKIDEMYRMYCE